MKARILFSLLCFFLILSSCHKKDKDELVLLKFVDRNGFHESISSKERLSMYKNTDFLASQPYSKVTRQFKRSRKGQVTSVVTSYHENGLLHQYLEVLDRRAHGEYLEYYPNGNLKVEAFVIEGIGDLNESCMVSWVFDGETKAYDEKGNLSAVITYDKGSLCGESTYYYESSEVLEKVPYIKGVVHGENTFYRKDGTVKGIVTYNQGLKDKRSVLYQESSDNVVFEEEYDQGVLVNGRYYDANQTFMSEVVDGSGVVSLFTLGQDGEEVLKELEYQSGKQEGRVAEYGSNRELKNLFFIKDGFKHGEEMVFYAGEKSPKLSIDWYEGKIEGQVKTWYRNGQLESEKQMSQNVKNGPSSAWYEDGKVMLIEEYERDKLFEGKYFNKNSSQVSAVRKGSGVATLYDKEGHYVRKVTYEKGEPVGEP